MNSVLYDEKVDIMKGICIIFMVLGHCFFPLSHFIYLFHMPVFFLAAGYCYNEKHNRDFYAVMKYMKRRLWSLWRPYIFFNIIYLTLHNWFLAHNLLTNDKRILLYTEQYILQNPIKSFKSYFIMLCKILLFGAEEYWGGAGWFLRVLFAISVFYCFTSYMLNKYLSSWKERGQIIISIFFLIIGYAFYLINWNYENIPVIFSCYILFCTGYFIRKYNFFSNVSIRMIIILLLILLVGNKLGSINLIDNSYTNPLFLWIMSVSGWGGVYAGIHYINLSILKKILIYVGKNTIPILFMHFGAFKLITFLQIKIYDYPSYALAAHPVLIHTDGWWILYGICGCVVPLIINYIFKHVQENIKGRLVYCEQKNH